MPKLDFLLPVLAFVDGQINFIIRTRVSRQSLSCIGCLDTIKAPRSACRGGEGGCSLSLLCLCHIQIYIGHAFGSTELYAIMVPFLNSAESG